MFRVFFAFTAKSLEYQLFRSVGFVFLSYIVLPLAL